VYHQYILIVSVEIYTAVLDAEIEIIMHSGEVGID
jgi:hypothetical protein